MDVNGNLNCALEQAASQVMMMKRVTGKKQKHPFIVKETSGFLTAAKVQL